MPGFDDDFFQNVLGKSAGVFNDFIGQGTPRYAEFPKAPVGQYPEFLGGSLGGLASGGSSDLFGGANAFFENLSQSLISGRQQQAGLRMQAAKKEADEANGGQNQNRPGPRIGESQSAYQQRIASGTGGGEMADQIRALTQERYGPEAAKVVGALLLAEGGMGGAVGDTNISAVGSHGPFQFYGPGGQLDNYARSLGMDLAAAGQQARQDPMHAARWALDNYLGQALQSGVSEGSSGEALLRRALSVQNAGALSSPEHYRRYQNALAQQDVIQAAAQSRAANSSVFTERFLQAADTWRGTPYALGGMSRAGIDCSALILAAAQEAGTPLPGGVRTAQQIHNTVQQVRPDLAQPGDLVFFQGTYEGNPGERDTHVGIVIAPGRMISASSGGVGTQNYNDAYWGSKITGFGRLR